MIEGYDGHKFLDASFRSQNLSSEAPSAWSPGPGYGDFSRSAADKTQLDLTLQQTQMEIISAVKNEEATRQLSAKNNDVRQGGP